MPGISLSLDEVAARGGRPPVRAWSKIYDLAVADNWLSLYDPSNPNTRTIREDAGVQYIEAIADALGNQPSAAQATATVQNIFAPNHFNKLDGIYHGLGEYFLTTAWAGFNLPYPWTKLAIGQVTSNLTDIQAMTGPNQIGCNAGYWALDGGSGTVQGTTLVDSNTHIIVGSHANDLDTIRVDGAIEAERSAAGIIRNHSYYSIGSRSRSSLIYPLYGYTGVNLLRADADVGAITRMEDLLLDLLEIPKAT